MSSKSMIDTRKRTEQGQDGEGPMCNSSRMASWRAQHKDLICELPMGGGGGRLLVEEAADAMASGCKCT